MAGADDLVIVYGVRRGGLAWSPGDSALPSRLVRALPKANILFFFPAEPVHADDEARASSLTTSRCRQRAERSARALLEFVDLLSQCRDLLHHLAVALGVFRFHLLELLVLFLDRAFL